MRTIWFLIIVGVSISCSSKEHNLFGSIKGEVRGQRRGGITITPPPPLSGVEVILSQDADILQRVTTKMGGKYEFVNLDSGSFVISVQKEGYNDQHIAVRVVSGEEANVAILLVEETNQ